MSLYNGVPIRVIQNKRIFYDLSITHQISCCQKRIRHSHAIIYYTTGYLKSKHVQNKRVLRHIPITHQISCSIQIRQRRQNNYQTDFDILLLCQKRIRHSALSLRSHTSAKEKLVILDMRQWDTVCHFSITFGSNTNVSHEQLPFNIQWADKISS